jgi:hypothetical protein
MPQVFDARRTLQRAFLFSGSAVSTSFDHSD